MNLIVNPTGDAHAVSNASVAAPSAETPAWSEDVPGRLGARALPAFCDADLYVPQLFALTAGRPARSTSTPES